MLEGIDDDMSNVIIDELALFEDHKGELHNRMLLDHITNASRVGNLALRLEQMFGVDVVDEAAEKWVTVQDVIDTINSLEKR
jgi:hypothetical protein